MSDAIDRVLERLVGVRKIASGWTAKCPAHEDNNPSLSIKEGDGGRVLLKCFAGCSFESIVATLSLEMTDLFSDETEYRSISTTPKAQIEAEYDYRDENGVLLYQAVRLTGKSFRQRRPNEVNGWIWNLTDVRRVPYRLPDLLANPDKPVIIVEGEKDVDRLSSLGVLATCNSGGAEKWRDEYSVYFESRPVYVIPDNDPPGRRHADQVLNCLHGVASSIKIIELSGLPENGDVSDWLDAGHSLDELRKLAIDAPEWRPPTAKEDQDSSSEIVVPFAPDLVCMADVEPEEVRWLWEPYIPRRKVTLLEGDPAAGKTWFALKLTAIVTRGSGWPDENGNPGQLFEPGNVLYLSCEDGLGDTLRPRLDAAGADVSRVTALRGRMDGQTLTLECLDTLRMAIEQVQPALMVIDPIQGFLGKIDMHRANEVRPLMAGLGKLAEEFDVAVVCIRHLRKSGADKASHRGLGSIDFTAHARSVLLAGQDPNDPDTRAIVHLKSSLAPEGPSVGYSLATGVFKWTGWTELGASDLFAPERKSSARDDAKLFLEDALAVGPMRVDDAIQAAKKQGISESTLKRAKHDLGITAKKEGFGGNSNWIWEMPAKDTKPSNVASFE